MVISNNWFYDTEMSFISIKKNNFCLQIEHNLKHYFMSFSIYFLFSMDVQGDYDPCDASGFIRINAVRLVLLETKTTCNTCEKMFTNSIKSWYSLFLHRLREHHRLQGFSGNKQ